jgi:ABC-type multidrug transport system fused ATPase/permease subunit
MPTLGEPLLRQESGPDRIGCFMMQDSVLLQPLLVPEGSYRDAEGEADSPFVSAGIPAGHWPAPGRVEFLGVMLRYAGQSVPALSGLDLDVPGGSKIGICGRTGKFCLESRHISSLAPLAGNTNLQPAPSNALRSG